MNLPAVNLPYDNFLAIDIPYNEVTDDEFSVDKFKR